MGSEENWPSEKEILNAKSEVDAQATMERANVVRELVVKFNGVGDSEISEVKEIAHGYSAIIMGHAVEVYTEAYPEKDFDYIGGEVYPSDRVANYIDEYKISIDGTQEPYGEVAGDNGDLNDLANKLERIVKDRSQK